MTRPPIALALFAPLAFAAACAGPADGPSLDGLDGPDGPEASALAAAEGAAPPPSFAATPPVPHAGEYRFQGRVVPLARLTVDVVNMLMQGSAERLARLQAAGATCQLVLSNTYRCKKMHGPEAVPASSLAALGAQDAGVFVAFGPQAAPPALINDAESLKEWQIFQPGSSSLGAFTGYRYLQLEGGLEKIVVPAAAGSGSLEFVVRDGASLAKHKTKNVTESQWRFHQDMAFVVFEPLARGRGAMCDTIAVVGPSGVLFAKNSDRDPNEAQRLDWQPRRAHAAGARLRCTWVEIAQARETNAVLLSRPCWGWGAEMGANEHGVVVGNEAVFTREPYADTGLTGMDLVRLALERAATAEAAVEAVVALLREHGQGGGCGHERRSFTYHNSFLVADPRGAFVLETAGRRHAIERVSGARSISNGLTIPGFAERHGEPLRSFVSGGRRRRARTQALAEGAAGPADLMRALRDHGAAAHAVDGAAAHAVDGGAARAPSAAAPHYSWLNGGLGAPCVHAGGLVASSQTTASWVAELRPEGARHWVTGTAAPCLGLFKPVRVGEPLDLGPAPTDRYDARALWWRHERLHRRVMRDPARLAPSFLPERDAIERAWLREPPEPAAAFDEADRLLDRWTQAIERVGATGPDRRPAFVRRYWARRDERAGLGAAVG